MDRETAEPSVDELPGPKARERIAYHRDNAAVSTYVYGFVWDTTAPAAGPFCTDADGNVLLDFTSHVAAAPLGYDNPRVLNRLEEFDLRDPMKIAGQDFYATAGDPAEVAYPGPAELMDRITDLAPDGMDTVFLSNSGAEAVENALKVAYDHTGGKYAITFEGAFHGRTLGTLSLNRSKEIYRRQFPEISAVHTVPFCAESTCAPPNCECGFFSGDGSALRRMLATDTGYVNPDEVAFLVLEPVQGEGGYRFPTDAFTEEIAALQREHDLTIVADEIQTGVGRSGDWWASDAHSYEPDIICSAKGLRVGATVGRESMFPDKRARLSSTWGAGDLVASAQGAATLAAIEEDGLLDVATRRGRQLREKLRDVDLPGAIDVRGRGLLVAVEWESKGCRDDVMDAAFERGLLTLGCGHRTLRLLPPMDVREREIAMGVDLLADAADAVA